MTASRDRVRGRSPRTGQPFSTPASDLPPWLVRLARQMARDCRAPGVYTVTLTVPLTRRAPRTVTINRVEAIRLLELS